jgi:hypothetical protein
VVVEESWRPFSRCSGLQRDGNIHRYAGRTFQFFFPIFTSKKCAIQCCGAGNGSAGTITFFRSTTETGMHHGSGSESGSGTGLGSGSNIKCKKSKKIKMRYHLSEK